MPLIGAVGRRRPRARLALVGLYAALFVGAVTTLYPFALMVSTGLKGPTDQNDGKLMPAYLSDDKELLTKYRDDKYAGDKVAMAAAEIGREGDVAEYRKFLSELEPDMFKAGFATAPNSATSRLQRRYQEFLRGRYGTIDRLNRAYVEENVGFQTITPPADLLERRSWSPPDTPKYREWRTFKAALPPEWRIPVRETRLWQEFVRAKYQNRFDGVPPSVASGATSFESLKVPQDQLLLAEFKAKSMPKRYAGGAAEAAWARRSDAPMPLLADEQAAVVARPQELRREFAGRNYAYVLDYILLNGRAVWNTFVFCALAILTQLIVNPLAAYALSRYPVRQSGSILIFLLATMAFPAEVAMIPSFLLLKGLGLLNTFAALVLPVAASGYMIFLLKGFFDSLPQELFEAGALDGASEVTLLTKVALPLSRPVFGYLALLAFMGAYSAFIYAFLVVQDQSMWTLSVFVYQLQNIAPRSVMMAALTLAALPTLLVFLLCQRVVTKGIVLPGER